MITRATPQSALVNKWRSLADVLEAKPNGPTTLRPYVQQLRICASELETTNLQAVPSEYAPSMREIYELRVRSGSPIILCKKALIAESGDQDRAFEHVCAKRAAAAERPVPLFQIRRVWHMPTKISLDPNGPGSYMWQLRRGGLHVEYYASHGNAMRAVDRRIKNMRNQSRRDRNY